MTSKFISIRGAREHNLKDISLDLPREKLVVITGLSGSGKSSLAFDTIYGRRWPRSPPGWAGTRRHQVAAQETRADLKLPLPLRGEGWGEGFKRPVRRVPPHPAALRPISPQWGEVNMRLLPPNLLGTKPLRPLSNPAPAPTLQSA